ncbi:MAG TPA: autotransporter outer membrane beta-barrel domain-containing protein, partial [Ancylobacter sp.]
GGYGGAVTVDTGGAMISTTGFAATGLMAQSIGGGGGIAGAAEFNASSLVSLGMTNGGNGGSGNQGGTVTLGQLGSDATTITTVGGQAHGVILQSIGGGGGLAEQGYSLVGNLPLAFFGGQSLTLTVGGSQGGNGGTVQTDPNSLPLLDISTSGQAAFGFIAQSVGGGGGIAGQMTGIGGTFTAGGANANSYNADGGTVNVALKDGSRIVTSGDSSFGLFAQSVGGGGGIAGIAASDTTWLSLPHYYNNTQNGNIPASHGDGGAVTVNTGNSTIVTTGAGAHGIFAQSVGSGGGIWASGDGVSANAAGTTGGAGSDGAGNTVTVTQDGTLIAAGFQSIGIFAQSTGLTNEKNVDYPINGTVTVNVNGYVSGGSGPDSWGVWVDSTNSVNSINIGADGLVRSDYGQAIQASGVGYNTVNNYGTVVGSYLLTTTLSQGYFNNEPGGVVVPQGTLKGDLTNGGTVFLASVLDEWASSLEASLAHGRAALVAALGEPQTTTLIGNLTQAPGGLIVTQADFSAGTIDRLLVTGDAALDGGLQVLSSNLLPNRSLTFLQVQGEASGTLEGVTANVFDFDVTRSGGDYAVSATADFTKASFGLTAGQVRAAQHLQAIWNAGGGVFGPLFGALSNIEASDYPGALSNLAADTVNAAGAESINLGQQHLDRLMSCPIFEGETAIVAQTSCYWAVGSGERFEQNAFDGGGSYSDTTYSYAVGLQKEFAPDWFYGIAAGFDDSSISGEGVSSDGSTGWVGVSLKHEIGPWLFAAAVSGSFGSFDISRTAVIGPVGGIAEGTSDLGGGSGRLRAAYTFGDDRFYAKPYLDLDLLYTDLSGYTEAGASLLDRQVSGSSEWTAMATPVVEFGTRLNLENGHVLRAYAKAGVTFSSTDSWSSTVRLLAAPAGVGGFDVVLPLDDVFARVGAGLDLGGFKNGLNLRAEYEGAFSEHTNRNMGSLRLSVQF